MICRLSSRSSSRVQVVSAFRAGRSFAVDHFGYEDHVWFPPRSVGHLSDFVALSEMRAPSNYVGCLKWFVSVHRLDHDWFDRSIGLQIKGFRKFTMHGMSTKLKAEMARLNQMVVNDVFDDGCF